MAHGGYARAVYSGYTPLSTAHAWEYPEEAPSQLAGQAPPGQGAGVTYFYRYPDGSTRPELDPGYDWGDAVSAPPGPAGPGYWPPQFAAGTYAHRAPAADAFHHRYAAPLGPAEPEWAVPTRTAYRRVDAYEEEEDGFLPDEFADVPPQREWRNNPFPQHPRPPRQEFPQFAPAPHQSPFAQRAGYGRREPPTAAPMPPPTRQMPRRAPGGWDEDEEDWEPERPERYTTPQRRTPLRSRTPTSFRDAPDYGDRAFPRDRSPRRHEPEPEFDEPPRSSAWRSRSAQRDQRPPVRPITPTRDRPFRRPFEEEDEEPSDEEPEVYQRGSRPVAPPRRPYPPQVAPPRGVLRNPQPAPPQHAHKPPPAGAQAYGGRYPPAPPYRRDEEDEDEDDEEEDDDDEDEDEAPPRQRGYPPPQYAANGAPQHYPPPPPQRPPQQPPQYPPQPAPPAGGYHQPPPGQPYAQPPPPQPHAGGQPPPQGYAPQGAYPPQGGAPYGQPPPIQPGAPPPTQAPQHPPPHGYPPQQPPAPPSPPHGQHPGGAPPPSYPPPGQQPPHQHPPQYNQQPRPPYGQPLPPPPSPPHGNTSGSPWGPAPLDAQRAPDQALRAYERYRASLPPQVPRRLVLCHGHVPNHTPVFAHSLHVDKDPETHPDLVADLQYTTSLASIPAASFDSIVVAYPPEWLWFLGREFQPAALWQEINRMLAPGGYVVALGLYEATLLRLQRSGQMPKEKKSGGLFGSKKKVQIPKDVLDPTAQQRVRQFLSTAGLPRTAFPNREASQRTYPEVAIVKQTDVVVVGEK